MKNLIFIAPIFLTICSLGQSATFKEIKLKPDHKYYSVADTTIVFPIVVTKNPQIDKLINAQIKNDLFHLEADTTGIETVLNENIHDEGLTDLSYHITFNNSGLLSFFIDAEGCGAHCSSWETYFNFDLKTGRKISVYELFSPGKIEKFKDIARSDKIKLLNKYKEDERGSFINKYIDSNTYNLAISQVDDECINKVSIENFSLMDDTFEIINGCEFPYAIRSQQPVFELKYLYKDISGFLNPAFRSLLNNYHP